MFGFTAAFEKSTSQGEQMRHHASRRVSGETNKRPNLAGTAPRVLAFLIASSACTFVAKAQWTVEYLNPPGSRQSAFFGGLATQHVGQFHVEGQGLCPGYWDESSASWINLSPAGSGYGIAHATNGVQQVGIAEANGIPGNIHASLWSGTAASWIDLNPVGSMYSVARAISSTHQAGEADVNGAIRASLWSGSAASWVDLHPTGATNSFVTGIDGVRTVGSARIGGIERASIWSGTRESWTSLHPAGASNSSAWAIAGTQQVGTAEFNGAYLAGYWTGTAESWVSINPLIATNSIAFATNGFEQVGEATVGGRVRASYWTGSAESWIDLSSFLSGNWGQTTATSIWNDGTTTFITGYGFNQTTSSWEALLWTRAIPTPGCAVLLIGWSALLTRRRVR